MPNSVVTLTNSLGGSSTQVTNSSGSFSTGTFNVSTITTSTGALLVNVGLEPMKFTVIVLVQRLY